MAAYLVGLGIDSISSTGTVVKTRLQLAK